jgi:hypothetical protein
MTLHVHLPSQPGRRRWVHLHQARRRRSAYLERLRAEHRATEGEQEAGERFAAAARSAMADLVEADVLATVRGRVGSWCRTWSGARGGRVAEARDGAEYCRRAADARGRSVAAL